MLCLNLRPNPLSNMMHPDRTQILWRQVWGLAALLVAILLSLLLYGLYQPIVLTQLGFAAGAFSLVQGLLGAVLEPVVGHYSDRILQRYGSRLPQITVGVTLTGLLFVVIALVLQIQLPLGLRWLVPVLMTLWLMALISFRGPVVALLMQFAPVAELPKANAVLVLVLGLTGAIAPLLQLALINWGASIGFSLGAIGLVIGAFSLYRTAPAHQLKLNRLSDQPLVRTGRLAAIGLLVFLTGFGAAWETNALLRLFPPLLNSQLSHWRVEVITSVLLLICALSAVPLERYALRWGVRRSMQLGLAAIGIGLGLGLLSRSLLGLIGCLLLLGLALGLVFISTIPYALSMMPPPRAGLSTGLYFGGSGAATGLISLLSWPSFDAVAGWSWAMLGGLLAIGCLEAGKIGFAARGARRQSR